MFNKIKNALFFLIYALLWTRYLCMAWDPYWGGVSLDQGLPVYQDWRSAFDSLYLISGYLMWPVYKVYEWLAPFLPKVSWFPGMPTASILVHLSEMFAKTPSLADKVALLQNPMLKQTLSGYLDFLVIPGLIFYRLLNPLLEILFDFLKNLIWSVLIEFSFTKRKETRYQAALQQRAADLMKLNVEYKNLSKEASVLAHSVITDEMTKVYNKRFFIEKITFEFKTAKEKKHVLAVAMVDIDHFKKLNDTYGHLVGDKVLKAVAQVAKSATPADCFCCRFGGEEFALIMPGKSLAEATEIVSGIHHNLPRLRFDDDPNMRTSASFGICVVDFKLPQAQGLNTFEDLIKLADDQLYQAKLNGRNRIEVNNLS